jgi:aspartyl-tRNA(Asn)/glutamyl-tRNA(Gln) amidotransferase subunit C
MSVDSQLDITYLAQLARIALTEEEAQLFQKQLSEVLDYIERLKRVDIADVKAAAHAVPLSNVLREDESRGWLTAEEALRNAPRRTHHLFIVPKVVE